ncbi:MAG: protein kinase [Myxococcales bacterium]|nr:protein kinase [Myxococcales bacterium]MBL0196741.1 protein kinase [Myxococcales bacterium]
MSSSSPDLPKNIGPYAVVAQIGEGGMANVYLAHREGPDGRLLPVALKVIREEFALNPEFAHMFADEARVATKMLHPNVVRVEESGAVDGRLFLAMEVLSGQSLWKVWQSCRERGLRLRYDLAAWIAARAADGLHHAHELRGDDGSSLDLVHRDVNQSNLFVTYEGDVKVIDFGLAKAANRVSQTAAGVLKGKLSYLAPEQVTGAKLDRRADIFALGVALWEVTVDRRLFKGRDDIDTLMRVNRCEVPDATTLVDGYPPRLWAIVSKCLAREREHRYGSAQALATDLDVFVRDCGQGVGRDSVAEVMQVLFAAEQQHAVDWFDRTNRASRASAPPPLQTEDTSLLMQNMPSLPPPPKVDLWLAAPPPGFSGPALPASERSGASSSYPPRPPNTHLETHLEQAASARAPRRVIAAVAGLVVTVALLIFLIWVLRSA